MKKMNLFLIASLMLVCLSCGNKQKDDMITVSLFVSGAHNGYDYVDLGLPSGLKWATCNVGAENPWDYGDYFAWGETKPKSYYDWSTYFDGIVRQEQDCGTDKDLLKSVKDIASTQYDAVRVNMGGSWRMPTSAEQQELVDNCYWKWTDSYNGKGVEGFIIYKVKDTSDKGKIKFSGKYKVTTVGSYSLTDSHIFLPAAGFVISAVGGLNAVGSYGYYWSSSFVANAPSNACRLTLQYMGGGGYVGVDDVYGGKRFSGQSVRGVVQ